MKTRDRDRKNCRLGSIMEKPRGQCGTGGSWRSYCLLRKGSGGHCGGSRHQRMRTRGPRVMAELPSIWGCYSRFWACSLLRITIPIYWIALPQSQWTARSSLVGHLLWARKEWQYLRTLSCLGSRPHSAHRGKIRGVKWQRQNSIIYEHFPSSLLICP